MKEMHKLGKLVLQHSTNLQHVHPVFNAKQEQSTCGIPHAPTMCILVIKILQCGQHVCAIRVNIQEWATNAQNSPMQFRNKFTLFS